MQNNFYILHLCLLHRLLVKFNNENDNSIEEVVFDALMWFYDDENERRRVCKYALDDKLSHSKRHNIISFFPIMIQVNLSTLVLKVVSPKTNVRVDSDSN